MNVMHLSRRVESREGVYATRKGGGDKGCWEERERGSGIRMGESDVWGRDGARVEPRQRVMDKPYSPNETSRATWPIAIMRSSIIIGGLLVDYCRYPDVSPHQM